MPPTLDRVGRPREPYTDEVFFVLTVPIGLSDYEFACGPMDKIISSILLDYFGASGGAFKATKSRIERAKDRETK
jgi:hypothetical protein